MATSTPTLKRHRPGDLPLPLLVNLPSVIGWAAAPNDPSLTPKGRTDLGKWWGLECGVGWLVGPPCACPPCGEGGWSKGVLSCPDHGPGEGSLETVDPPSKTINDPLNVEVSKPTADANVLVFPRLWWPEGTTTIRVPQLPRSSSRLASGQGASSVGAHSASVPLGASTGFAVWLAGATRSSVRWRFFSGPGTCWACWAPMHHKSCFGLGDDCDGTQPYLQRGARHSLPAAVAPSWWRPPLDVVLRSRMQPGGVPGVLEPSLLQTPHLHAHLVPPAGHLTAGEVFTKTLACRRNSL